MKPLSLLSGICIMAGCIWHAFSIVYYANPSARGHAEALAVFIIVSGLVLATALIEHALRK